MQKENPNNQNESSKYSYTIISDYFLEEWTEVLGTGPSMLYIHLLKYCYKGKDLVWPTLATLSKKMQLTPKTITKYHQVLAKYGLIKKITKRKTSPGGHMRNIYQLTPINLEKNTLPIGNIFPYIEEKITPDIGKKLPTNNNNLNNINTTTTNSKKDAVAAVDFKKLDKKGEEKMRAPYSSKEHYTGQAIREQLIDLDFKESFVKQLLKDFDPKKIEAKLDLLLARKNIQNPAGWLLAALKNDYQDPETYSNPNVIASSDSSEHASRPSTENKKISSREEALQQIQLAKHRLDAITPSYQIKRRW